jgi:YVTN family beta-propeller protein
MTCWSNGVCRVLRMTTSQKTALAVMVIALVAWVGCGDVFRPVAVPLPSPVPDPKSFHFAVVLSQNAAGNPGTAMQIDVSGDSNVGVVAPGNTPVHAMLLPPNATRVYVANGTADTVSTFVPANPLASIGPVTTISFPIGADPVFLHSVESGSVYAADFGSNDVAVINATTNVVTSFIPVGPNPNLLAETQDARKLYSLNSGNHTITSINPVNRTVNATFAVPGAGSASWIATSMDSAQLFVLDSTTGNIVALDTMTDTVASTTSASAGAGANFMLLDRHLNRLYVTNPVSNTLSIFDASVSNASTATPPALLKSIPLPAPPSSGPTAPIMMVSALNDGTKVYVASYQASSTAMTAEVSVIRTSDNTVIGQPITVANVDLTTVPAGALANCAAARFRTSIASSVDSSRVYVSVCDAGTTTILNTTGNTLVFPMNSPVSAYPAQTPPTPPAPPPKNPVMVVAGP